MQQPCNWPCYKWKDSVTPCQIISHDGDRGKFDCAVFYSAGARGQSDFDIFCCANECAAIGLSIPTVCLIRNISLLAETRRPAAIRAAVSIPRAPAWRSGPGGVSRLGRETDRLLCHSVCFESPPTYTHTHTNTHTSTGCYFTGNTFQGARGRGGFHILD